MKAVIIDTFNYFEFRTKYVYDVLVSHGYEVTFLVSDFDHISKTKINEIRKDTVFVDTKPYFKNISVARLKSHLNFSKQVYKKLCEIKPDLIYSLIPVNSLAKRVYKYKKKNHRIKVFFDIYDLWPESMPVGNSIKKLLFPWRNLRDKYLKCADKIFLECSYYKNFLPKNLNYTVAYLCKERRDIDYRFDVNELRFLYLGSINNIIDIDGIVDFLQLIKNKRKVRLIIIGGGESEAVLTDKLDNAEIPFTNYGKIFDEEEKDKIISSCQFGLNMYKQGLSIGLTMKSLDYFCRGLPIINHNIYDTAKIIEDLKCGINVDMPEISLLDINEDTWNVIHQNVKKAYISYFSVDCYVKILAATIFSRGSN